MSSSEKEVVSRMEDYPPETIASATECVVDFLHTLAWSACLVSASEALLRPGSHVYSVRKLNITSPLVAFPVEVVEGGPLATVWRESALPKLIASLKDSLHAVPMFPADRHELLTGAYFLKAPKFVRSQSGSPGFPWTSLVSVDGTDAFLEETMSAIRAAVQRRMNVTVLDILHELCRARGIAVVEQFLRVRRVMREGVTMAAWGGDCRVIQWEPDCLQPAYPGAGGVTK